MNFNTRVNLKSMTQVAQNISDNGFNMSVQFEKILFQIKSMQEYWRGEAYLNFVKKINIMVNSFTEIADYYTVVLPKEIINKRNEYARTMNEIEEEISLRSAITLEKLIIKEQGDVIVYRSAAIEIKINQIYNIFDHIKVCLNEIEDEFLLIKWDDIMENQIKADFEGKIETTRKTVNSIKMELKNHVITQMELMEKAEKENALIENQLDIPSTINKNITKLDYEIQNDVSDWQLNT